MNKKINNEIAVGIILFLVFVIGGIFYLQKNKHKQAIPTVQQKQPISNQQQKIVTSADNNQKQQSAVNYKEPEKTVCDKKRGLVDWDESINGSYYTRGSSFFTISYPCDYTMEFKDMASFYVLQKDIKEPGLIITEGLTEGGRINGLKELYKNPIIEILNDKYDTPYPHKIYQIAVDKDEQSPGECFECPGNIYKEIEVKISNKLYYNFIAPIDFDKNILKNILESFRYNEK